MDNLKKKLFKIVLILIPCFFLMIGMAQEIKQPPKKLALLRPDLTVRIVAPPKAFSGAELGERQYVQVKNIGHGPAEKISVDIVLSAQKLDPLRPSPFTRPEKFLKHIQKTIKGLKAGASINVSFPGFKIPDTVPPGTYYLASVVDRTNAIAESNEKNNIAIHDFFIIAKIQGMNQHHGGSPTAELSLNGQGFGSTAGNKQVYVGTDLAGYLHHWSFTMIVVNAPSGIPYGEDYVITIKQGTTTISNSFNFLLRMWTDAVDPDNGPPGTAITLYGFHFGNTQGSKVLKLGTQTLNVTSWQDYQIQATIPNNTTPGTHTLTIWNGPKLISNQGTSFTVQ